MWYYVQYDMVVGWIWLLFLEELAIYLYGLMVWLYIYFTSDLRNHWTKYKTKWGEVGTSVFKSEFSSSFEKFKKCNLKI